MLRAVLHTDGGARGNPGPAGVGGFLKIDDREEITFSDYIGKATNNIAEYEALKTGMTLALNESVTHLTCYLDSELVVKQLKGEYRVKNEGLKPIYNQINNLATEFTSITFKHVLREKNKKADKLVNRAIDRVVK